MRGAKTVGGTALLAALLLGAPGCATAGPVGEAPSARVAGVEPAATPAVGGASAGGGLAEACNMGGGWGPSAPAVIGIGALLLLASPFLLVYAVVGTPLRVLTRRF